jgi:hypothetical protein
VEEAIEEIKTEEAAPVTPEAPTFDRNALNTTLTSLLKRWNTNAASQKLNGSEVGDILAYGNAHGFSTTALRATPDKLLNINLPMLVQLNSEQGPVWAAWLNGDDTQATLSLHDRSTVTHSYEALNKLYAGNAVIFWRDPYAYQRALHEDEQGEPIWVIQHQLVSLGLRKKEPNGIYDTETFNTVKQIQFLSGLPIDGVLGSQTRMVLSSWLDKGNSPHLMEGLPASLPINPASEDTIEATMPSPEAPAVPAPTPSEPAIEVPIQDETTDEEPYTPLIVETPEVTQSTITEPARTLVPLRPITQDDDQTEGAQEKE